MSTVMGTNPEGIAVSSLYTAATWQWAGLPGAEHTTPPEAAPVFRWVNRYMRLYRWINPATYSLPHQLLHRHTAIDAVCREVLARSGGSLIEIAAGFSARGLRFSALPGVKAIEIDLPAVVGAKHALLEACDPGREALAQQSLRLLAGDVTRLNWPDLLLGQPSPTVVTAEGLMMYFPRPAQISIWRTLAEGLSPQGGTFVFDYIPRGEDPARSLLGRMLHWIKSDLLRVPSGYAYDERSAEAVREDLLAAGFDTVDVQSTRDLARAWSLPQAEVPTHTLIYRAQKRPTPARSGGPT